MRLLIEMMQVLRESPGDYRLLIVGDGPERQSLQALAGELLHGNVCFLDHISDRDRLAEVYASCDVFVHPNPREPFGIAPLEAMASGVPLVAPDAGGITSFANATNAWLAQPNATAFAAAVGEALQQDCTRNARVQAGMATAEAHSWDRSAQAYFALYDAVHAQFWGLQHGVSPAPYCSTTPANRFLQAMFSAYATVARSVFRTAIRVAARPSQALGPGQGITAVSRRCSRRVAVDQYGKTAAKSPGCQSWEEPLRSISPIQLWP